MNKKLLTLLLLGGCMSIQCGLVVTKAQAQAEMVDDAGISDNDDAGDGAEPGNGGDPTEESNETAGGGGDPPEGALNDGDGDGWVPPEIMTTMGGVEDAGAVPQAGKHDRRQRMDNSIGTGGNSRSPGCVLKALKLSRGC